MITQKQIAVIRGKAMLGRVDEDDLEVLFEYLDKLESYLDTANEEDLCGQDWRIEVGVE